MRFMFLVFLGLIACIQSQNPNPWKAFVENPSKDSFSSCKKELEYPLLGNVPVESTATFRHLMEPGVFRTLTDLVATGNEMAAEISLHLIRFLRARPDLGEEIAVSVGQFFKSKPASFLSLLETYNRENSNRSLRCSTLLGNLGADFVDKPLESIEELERRIKLLKSIQDTLQLKEQCIMQLEEAIVEWQRMLK